MGSTSGIIMGFASFFSYRILNKSSLFQTPLTYDHICFLTTISCPFLTTSHASFLYLTSSVHQSLQTSKINSANLFISILCTININKCTITTPSNYCWTKVNLMGPVIDDNLSDDFLKPECMHHHMACLHNNWSHLVFKLSGLYCM